MTEAHTMIPIYAEGDRVRVSKDVTTTPALPGYVGVVQEVVLSYADRAVGYNVCLDDDPRKTRKWFFLEHQLSGVKPRR